MEISEETAQSPPEVARVTWTCKCGSDPDKNCPKFAECEDKIMLQAGIRIWRSDMTPEELKQHYPVTYVREWGIGKVACPVCLEAVSGKDKRALIAHARARHPEWYKENLKSIQAADDLEGWINAYRSPVT